MVARPGNHIVPASASDPWAPARGEPRPRGEPPSGTGCSLNIHTAAPWVHPKPWQYTMPELHATHHDTVDTKVKLLLAARASGDTALALCLTTSLRESLQLEAQLSGELSSPFTGETGAALSHTGGAVATLPGPWRAWAAGWRWFTAATVTEPAGLARRNDVVEVVLNRLPAAQLRAPRRELRVAQLVASAGSALPTLRETPSQLLDHSLQKNGTRSVRLLISCASVAASETLTFLILHGNPAADVPHYSTDLAATGHGLGLTISNTQYSADLNPDTGQLHTLRYGSAAGTVLTAVGNGHGEQPGFDWGNGGDYLDRAPEGTPGWQKFRTTNWHAVPDATTVSGPLAVRVRRCGFPLCAVPPLYSQARMHIDTEYIFLAGKDYFIKQNKISFVQDMSLNYMRECVSSHSYCCVPFLATGNRRLSFDASALLHIILCSDEWVFSGANDWFETCTLPCHFLMNADRVPRQALDEHNGEELNKTASLSFAGLSTTRRSIQLPTTRSLIIHSGWRHALSMSFHTAAG